MGAGDDKADQVVILTEGKSVQFTHAKAGVVSFQWAPDGRGLYFLAPDPERKEELKRRNERYGDFAYIDKDYVWNCVYYQELPSGAAGSILDSGPKDLRRQEDRARKLVGDDGLHILSYAVSLDNGRLAFMAAPTPDSEDQEQAALYLMDMAQGEYRELPVPKPLDGEVLFSPTGDEICYSRPINEGKWFNITTLEILDLASGNTRQPLLGLDECPYPVRWTRQGLVFTMQQKTNWYVSLLDNEGSVVPLRAEPGSVTMMASVSESGLHLATLTATREKPFEIYLNGTAVTNRDRYYQGKTLSSKEVINWTSKDGTEIEGILITPPDINRSKPHPLLVVVHGGPTSAAFATPSDSLYYPYEQFMERGFIILDVNYRGSSGYGEKFRKLNYRNLGLGDYQDVITGVDMLVEQGLADTGRVGIMGWSQGGYISAMCATYSRRFKAISVGAGISSWYTYYANTDIPPFTRHYLGDTPWNDREIYDRTSPITYIRQACTPTLIQHGDQDARVPYANARELHRGLKDMGVPVQLVSFKGMGHGANKPGLNRAIMRQNYAWFCTTFR